MGEGNTRTVRLMGIIMAQFQKTEKAGEEG